MAGAADSCRPREAPAGCSRTPASRSVCRGRWGALGMLPAAAPAILAPPCRLRLTRGVERRGRSVCSRFEPWRRLRPPPCQAAGATCSRDLRGSEPAAFFLGLAGRIGGHNVPPPNLSSRAQRERGREPIKLRDSCVPAGALKVRVQEETLLPRIPGRWALWLSLNERGHGLVTAGGQADATRRPASVSRARAAKPLPASEREQQEHEAWTNGSVEASMTEGKRRQRG